MPNLIYRAGVTAASGLLALTLVSCAPGGTASGGESDSLTLLMPTGVTSLDPALVSDAYGQAVQSFMYDKLLAQDPVTGEAVSNLAGSWVTEPNRSVFEIKEGITCSNGDPFTAETVKRNLDRMKDPDTGAPLTGQLLGSTNYEVEVDGNTVTVTYPEPQMFAELKIAQGPGMICDFGLDDPSQLEKTSAGTGPYVLERAVTGDSYEMSLREDYAWGGDGASVTDEMPRNLTIRLIESPDTIANLLSSGDADIALLNGDALVRATSTDDVSRVVATNGNTSAFFNHRPEFATSDPAVRHALSQALSSEEFVQVAGGNAQAARTVASQGACTTEGLIDDDLPQLDLDAAASSLEGAGWKKNANDIWEKDGAPLVIRIVNLGVAAPAVEYVRSSWSDFGAEVQVDSRSGSEAIQAAFGGTEHEVVITAFSSDIPAFHLLAGPTPPDGVNFSMIENAEYDTAVAQLRETGGTECGFWEGAERALLEQADVLPLATTTLEYVSQTWDLGAGSTSYFLVPTDLRPKA